jgi:hypothetical protein
VKEAGHESLSLMNYYYGVNNFLANLVVGLRIADYPAYPSHTQVDGDFVFPFYDIPLTF